MWNIRCKLKQLKWIFSCNLHRQAGRVYIQNLLQANESKVNDFSIKRNNKRGPMHAWHENLVLSCDWFSAISQANYRHCTVLMLYDKFWGNNAFLKYRWPSYIVHKYRHCCHGNTTMRSLVIVGLRTCKQRKRTNVLPLHCWARCRCQQ
jgi:hypothetical protein